MKKIIFYIFICFLCSSCFCKTKNNIDHVVITQEYYDSFYNKTICIEIYNGTSEKIEKFVQKVENAKTINPFFVIKEALVEGEFLVEFYEKDNLKLKYEIFNSQNAYDILNKKSKKIKVIDIIPNKLNVSYNNRPITIREDLFINLMEASIIKTFGDNYIEIQNFIYDSASFPKTERDPDYSKYFTIEDYGKTIKVMKWTIENKTLIIWFIQTNNNECKSFASLEYTDEVVF